MVVPEPAAVVVPEPAAAVVRDVVCHEEEKDPTSPNSLSKSTRPMTAAPAAASPRTPLTPQRRTVPRSTPSRAKAKEVPDPAEVVQDVACHEEEKDPTFPNSLSRLTPTSSTPTLRAPLTPRAKAVMVPESAEVVQDVACHEDEKDDPTFPNSLSRLTPTSSPPILLAPLTPTAEAVVVPEPSAVVQDVACNEDEKDPTFPMSLSRSTPTSSPTILLAPLTQNSSSGMTDSSSKLEGLRASKTELESQLRQLFLDPPRSSTPTPSVNKASLIEPEVYADMKDELVHAYEVIELQKQHLHEARQQQNQKRVGTPPFGGGGSGSSSGSSSGSESEDPSPGSGDPISNENNNAVELHDNIRQLEEAHAYKELELHNRITNMSREFKATIKHWKRETKCWRQRFESSWEDHQRTIQQLSVETKELTERAINAELKVANLLQQQQRHQTPNGAMAELIKAKARIEQLEAILNLRGENINPNNNDDTTSITVASILAKETNIDNIAAMDIVVVTTDHDSATTSQTLRAPQQGGSAASSSYTRSVNPPALQASLLEEAMKNKPHPRSTRIGLLAGWLHH